MKTKVSVKYASALSYALSLLGSLIASGDTLTVQTGSNIQIVNYLDLQGDLIVEGIFGVQ